MLLYTLLTCMLLTTINSLLGMEDQELDEITKKHHLLIIFTKITKNNVKIANALEEVISKIGKIQKLQEKNVYFHSELVNFAFPQLPSKIFLSNNSNERISADIPSIKSEKYDSPPSLISPYENNAQELNFWDSTFAVKQEDEIFGHIKLEKEEEEF